MNELDLSDEVMFLIGQIDRLGNYYLNDTTKIKLSPILNELTSMNYKTSYGLVE